MSERLSMISCDKTIQDASSRVADPQENFHGPL